MNPIFSHWYIGPSNRARWMWYARVEAWPGLWGMGETKEEAWDSLKQNRAEAVRRGRVNPYL